jgi:SAM-dependent methyltransferase
VTDPRDPAAGAARPENRPTPGLGFDSAYLGSPPWDIGAPQPAIAGLAERGAFGKRVLDAGCGTGEHALLAAERGCEAAGIDASPRAIDLAKGKAAVRGVAVRFLVWDALELGSLGEQFDTVIDSGLFHVFDDPSRACYVDGLRQITVPGGNVLLLCFSDRVPGDFGPRRVTRAELEASFAEGWQVDSIEEVAMSVTFAPGHIPAWLAVMTRVVGAAQA